MIQIIDTVRKVTLKPVWLGYNENVPVQFVNTPKQIYQLSDAATIAITGDDWLLCFWASTFAWACARELDEGSARLAPAAPLGSADGSTSRLVEAFAASTAFAALSRSSASSPAVA